MKTWQRYALIAAATYLVFWAGGFYSFGYTHECVRGHTEEVEVEDNNGNVRIGQEWVCDYYTANENRWNLDGPVKAVVAREFSNSNRGFVLLAIAAAFIIVTVFVAILSPDGPWHRRRKRVDPATNAAVDEFRSVMLRNTEVVLGQSSPADFETTQNAASMCVGFVANIEILDSWSAGYDSLDSFYAAHEARHPDIRFYAAVGREIGIEDPDDPPDGTGALIAQLIASRRAGSGIGS